METFAEFASAIDNDITGLHDSPVDIDVLTAFVEYLVEEHEKRKIEGSK